MKIYQLSAYGNLSAFEDHYRIFSRKVYRTEEQARAAMPGFAKLVTRPRSKHDMIVLEKKKLSITINPLELINNKKKEKKSGRTEKQKR